MYYKLWNRCVYLRRQSNEVTNQFRQQNSLFCSVRCFFAGWALFFARWGLLYASLYIQICNSPAILLNLGDPSERFVSAVFQRKKLKLLSLCTAGTQPMADTYRSVLRR